MRKLILYITLFLAIHISISGEIAIKDSLNISPFGYVYVYKPSETPKNIIIMISGDAGWKEEVTGFAQNFSEKNNIVIGVDIVNYYKHLRQKTDECYRVTADFVSLATVIEKKYTFAEYIPPVIMGYSSGATLVYGILAQARPGTFTGGISLGFCPEIKLPKMLCQTNGLSVKANPGGKSYILQPDAKLGNQWIVLQGKLDNVCSYSEASDFVSKTADAELITLPNIGHGFSKWSDFMPQLEDAFKRLTEKNEQIKPADYNINDVKNLPFVITPARVQIKDAPIALNISGDGGWYSFEQLIANKLADLGIPTLGLDSKKYFWNRRTPEETASDIAKALTYYSKTWGKDQFILIGYSLGAELIPFIFNRLPQDLKSKVSMSILLSPNISTDFEIHITNMLGMGNNNNTYIVADEIKKMQPFPVLCIFGNEEKSKVPDLLKETPVNISIIPGDHHYKFNISLIVKTMRDNKAF